MFAGVSRKATGVASCRSATRSALTQRHRLVRDQRAEHQRAAAEDVPAPALRRRRARSRRRRTRSRAATAARPRARSGRAPRPPTIRHGIGELDDAEQRRAAARSCAGRPRTAAPAARSASADSAAPISTAGSRSAPPCPAVLDHGPVERRRDRHGERDRGAGEMARVGTRRPRARTSRRCRRRRRRSPPRSAPAADGRARRARAARSAAARSPSSRARWRRSSS